MLTSRPEALPLDPDGLRSITFSPERDAGWKSATTATCSSSGDLGRHLERSCSPPTRRCESVPAWCRSPPPSPLRPDSPYALPETRVIGLPEDGPGGAITDDVGDVSEPAPRRRDPRRFGHLRCGRAPG